MKVMIATRTNLNEKMIEETFEIVRTYDEADFVIAQSTIDCDWDRSKVIYIAVEPPLADHRLFCYSKFNEFHTVITHNPDTAKDNQFPFTASDEAQYYPTNPVPSVIPRYTREDTKIKNRAVFYAGMIGPYEMQPNAFGGINITKVRRVLAENFSENPLSKIMGIGWKRQTLKVNNWRVNKSQQIRDSDCDFVLSLENTMLPNYLYEKIWDGFASDRVTLYLGDPNIENHIPLECFVDLRSFFNRETGEIDTDGINILIGNMTQEQYDEILENARSFRETAVGKHQELQDKLTKFIISRIKGKCHGN